MIMMQQCEFCGQDFPVETPHRGRPRKYCTHGHAQAAWLDTHPLYQARYQKRYRIGRILARILAERRGEWNQTKN
jgi:hypothetical protein